MRARPRGPGRHCLPTRPRPVRPSRPLPHSVRWTDREPGADRFPMRPCAAAGPRPPCDGDHNVLELAGAQGPWLTTTSSSARPTSGPSRLCQRRLPRHRGLHRRGRARQAAFRRPERGHAALHLQAALGDDPGGARDLRLCREPHQGRRPLLGLRPCHAELRRRRPDHRLPLEPPQALGTGGRRHIRALRAAVRRSGPARQPQGGARRLLCLAARDT